MTPEYQNSEPEIPPGHPSEIPPGQLPPDIPPGNPVEAPQSPSELPPAPPVEVPEPTTG
ncbi:MAG: hypothetical protein ACO22K_13395 [Woeseiaceae bacterium]|jgi:hypothetical protein